MVRDAWSALASVRVDAAPGEYEDAGHARSQRVCTPRDSVMVRPKRPQVLVVRTAVAVAVRIRKGLEERHVTGECKDVCGNGAQ